MNSQSKLNAENVNVIIMSIAFVALFFTGFLLQNDNKFMILYYIGWIMWACSLILAFSPNFIFKKYGGVAKGNSYANTTKLVDRGIYSIIRHPQYGGGLYIAISLVLIQQTMISVILGTISVITMYLSMIFEDKRLIVKFGEEYKAYMQRVPRVNFILGIFRKLKDNKEDTTSK